MKKNQNGVTLISLVITIVVMLIIAGAAIATLGGDNGLITNARRASFGNTEAEVVEKMNTAFNTVYSEVQIKAASEVGFQPSVEKKEFVDGVIEDLGGAEYVNDLTTMTGSTDPQTRLEDGKYNIYFKDDTLVILYKDTTFALAAPTTATNYPIATTATTTEYPQDNQYAMLVGQIVFTKSSVSYIAPIKTAL